MDPLPRKNTPNFTKTIYGDFTCSPESRRSPYTLVGKRHPSGSHARRSRLLESPVRPPSLRGEAVLGALSGKAAHGLVNSFRNPGPVTGSGAGPLCQGVCVSLCQSSKHTVPGSRPSLIP